MKQQQGELDPQDRDDGSPTYHNPEISQQHEEGLLARWEADLRDILTMKDVALLDSFSSGAKQAAHQDEQGQRVLLSQMYIHCQWSDVPFLRHWITQFLAGRQPDAIVIATGMAKQGMTKIALDEQQTIEGYIVIGSTEQELHGSVAECVAEHLVAEGQIRWYAMYTVPLTLCLL
jgi:hypothetical protein